MPGSPSASSSSRSACTGRSAGSPSSRRRVSLAYFLYVGSPSSKENDDRVEAKIDALLELVGKKQGLELIKQIDDSHLRRHGHAQVHVDPPYVRDGE